MVGLCQLILGAKSQDEKGFWYLSVCFDDGLPFCDLGFGFLVSRLSFEFILYWFGKWDREFFSSGFGTFLLLGGKGFSEGLETRVSE